MTSSSLITRIKCALVLIILMVFSVAPIPITSTIALWVVIFRPKWFKQLVDKIYVDWQGS